jgi:glycogen debranching enzyme
MKPKYQETFIKDNQYYILASSSYADDRTKVLNYGNTFGVFDRWGDMKRIGQKTQGIYHEGTRFLSDMEFRIYGHRPMMLSSSVKYENESQSVDLTNPDLSLPNGDNILKGSIHIARTKFLKEGYCYEKFCIHNYELESYEVELTFTFHADFKDIFEVRGMKREKRGTVHPVSTESCCGVNLSYEGLDQIKRTTQINFSPKPAELSTEKVAYKLKLEPQQEVNLYITMVFQVGEQKMEPESFESAWKKLEEKMEWGKEQIAHLYSSNEQFNDWINRSKFDLLSLLAHTPYGKYPYAGVPWYNTVFGRDGIITAMQTLWIDPDISKGVLRYLGHNQAQEENAFQDAEPGKILHEQRGGEMAELGELPFKHYYGTIDATPLFIILAGKYYKRTGDQELLSELWEVVKKAVAWIDNYGDLDGDGFVEYQHKSERGLTNQGWKDSFDSVSYEDGRLADAPIALCEVQAYVYEAKLEAAYLAEQKGEQQWAAELKQQAEELKRKFNEVFWDEQMGTFVLALDGKKQPCRIKTSNVGHCLFSGIVEQDKAEKVVQSLMGEDMFTGWGIRTLSTEARRYNPMSYHNGSVWPHDTAMGAYGMSRYGFKKENLQVMEALFNAAIFIPRFRIPELFCGMKVRKGEAPTDYPVACSPQAWAVGTVFLLMQACLDMEIDAVEKKVIFKDSVLPDFINSLHISNIRLGNEKLNVQLYRYSQNNVGLNILEKPEGWQVVMVRSS